MSEITSEQAAEFFLHTLCSVHCVVMKKINFELPANHAMILNYLDTNGPITATEICKRLIISKQQLAPIINKIIESGYIEKTPIPTDKRSYRLSLTPTGLKRADAIHDKVRNLFKVEFQQLSPEKQKEIYSIIQSYDKTICQLFNVPTLN